MNTSFRFPMTAHASRAATLFVLGALAATALTAAHASAAPPPAGTVAAPAAETTPSGLVYRVLKAGDGPSPQATDTVRVHYRGTFPDGREFDSSIARGQPAQFPLNRVIRCWTEGVQKMKLGGKAAFVCPPAIAYGERGTPGGPIPPNATLHFEVELLGISGR
jgi:FKBP-type peptidyl-prolyl cis-trans isomerase FkpA